jgi:hypothetical protein
LRTCSSQQEVRELPGERLERLSSAAADELRHPDYVLEMPAWRAQWVERMEESDGGPP